MSTSGEEESPDPEPTPTVKVPESDIRIEELDWSDYDYDDGDDDGDDDDGDDKDDGNWLSGFLVISINEKDKQGRKRLIRLAPIRERIDLKITKEIIKRAADDLQRARKERDRLAKDAVAVRVKQRKNKRDT